MILAQVMVARLGHETSNGQAWVNVVEAAPTRLMVAGEIAREVVLASVVGIAPVAAGRMQLQHRRVSHTEGFANSILLADEDRQPRDPSERLGTLHRLHELFGPVRHE